MKSLWNAVTVLSLGFVGAAEASDNVVDLNYFKTYVNHENCVKDQRHYLACISALQVLTAGLDSELNLKTQTTGADFLNLEKTKLALNANNLKLVSQAREASNANIDVNESLLKQIFMRNQKNKADFRRDFEPAYYHFKVASNDVISDVLDYLGKTYPTKLTEDVWMGAINEYIHVSRDPHSDWRLAEQTSKSIGEKASEYVGLGIRFVQSPLGATIQMVIKGSGADAAKLAIDDTILSVNGQELKGLNADLISSAIRGEEGGSISLRILRSGKTFEVTATRKKVVTPVVSHSIHKASNATLGLVRLENFMYSNGCEDVAAVLNQFKTEKVDRVLLDLRGNGGGSVSIAECLAGLFMGPGKAIAYSEGPNLQGLPPASLGSALERAQMLIQFEVEQLLEEAGPNIKEDAYQEYLNELRSPKALERLTLAIELNDHGLSAMLSSEEQLYDGKLAVLVDGESASASELLAGAFRDLNRAVIVGQTTYGKGSYQTIGGSYGRFQRWETGGLFFQPSGSTNQTIGVKPHVEAYRALEPSIAESFQMREKDLFLFPLEPRSIRNVVPDADKMDTLRVSSECLKSKDVKAAFNSMTEPVWKDMQVLTAAAALSCL